LCRKKNPARDECCQSGHYLGGQGRGDHYHDVHIDDASADLGVPPNAISCAGEKLNVVGNGYALSKRNY
jgi:hypothetical protein